MDFSVSHHYAFDKHIAIYYNKYPREEVISLYTKTMIQGKGKGKEDRGVLNNLFGKNKINANWLSFGSKTEIRNTYLCHLKNLHA